MTDLIGGSHYSLGLLFEVILNCFKESQGNKGKVLKTKIIDSNQLHTLLNQSIEYLNGSKNHLVDAIVITNIRNRGVIDYIAMDFSDKAAQSI
jgi:hypothetical protein